VCVCLRCVFIWLLPVDITEQILELMKGSTPIETRSVLA